MSNYLNIELKTGHAFEEESSFIFENESNETTFLIPYDYQNAIYLADVSKANWPAFLNC